MYFSHRTVQCARAICIGVFGFLALVALLAALVVLFRDPAPSYGQVFLTIMIGLPAVLVLRFVLEVGGEKFLSLPFWQEMSGPVRVLGLVCVIVALVIVVGVLVHWYE
jgi:hypothetical protein